VIASLTSLGMPTSRAKVFHVCLKPCIGLMPGLNLVWLGFAASQVFSPELWPIYKLFVQPAILLAAPLVGAWLVTKKAREDKTR